MSVQVITSAAKFKKMVQVQQVAGVADAALLAPTVAQVLANGMFPVGPTGILPTPDHITIESLPANTGTITISNVTGNGSLGVGFVLSPGQTQILPTRVISDWRVIASAAAQNINIVYGYGNI